MCHEKCETQNAPQPHATWLVIEEIIEEAIQFQRPFRARAGIFERSGFPNFGVSISSQREGWK